MAHYPDSRFKNLGETNVKVFWMILLGILPGFLFGEIITVNRIDTVKEWVDNETLCVLDLNDTLMQTADYLGSDTWAAKEIAREMKETGKTKGEIYEFFIPLWHTILIRSKTLPIEENTAEVILSLQERGIPLLGLTARYIEMAYPTHSQLQSIGIDLSKNTLYPYDKEIEGGFASKFIQGIVFVGLKNDKGETLFRFLDSIQYKPKRVVYVDDKLKNIESVRKVVEERGISYIGIHYTYIEENRQN